MKKIILIGSPNVGKSLIFHQLTGVYVAVSNYPGTTVEVASGECRMSGMKYEVIDTPGIYSLLPLTGEEIVTRKMLNQFSYDTVIHVIDAKNISKALHLTIQLVEAGLPVVVVLNMIDEAQKLGMVIDTQQLSRQLGVPVYETIAIRGIGIRELQEGLALYQRRDTSQFKFDDVIEASIAAITRQLRQEYFFSQRFTAILFLQGDRMTQRLLERETAYQQFLRIKRELREQCCGAVEQVIITARQRTIDTIIDAVINKPKIQGSDSWGWLSRATIQPFSGYIILFLVLYIVLYQLVGRFGAGFLVDVIDKVVFGEVIQPLVAGWVLQNIHEEWLQSLLVGEFGIFTLGVRYSIAIVLPIVSVYFLTFAFLEDCGYLPRVALLLDWIFRRIGLNGRAVIPVVLGFGCGTMAVVTTRTLESRRERVLTTFLLVLAIPCSAQLGVVIGLLSYNSQILLAWAVSIFIIFMLAGKLASHVVVGKRNPFYMEIPPLRLPKLSNVFKKAYMRVSCYFIEIVPWFMLASVFVWLVDAVGLLTLIYTAVEPLMQVLGLPREMAQAFLLGFVRRDYGAAGLYDLIIEDRLNDLQLLVAAITLTLFVPCIAQVAVLAKEVGTRTAIMIVIIVMTVAFTCGYLANIIWGRVGLSLF